MKFYSLLLIFVIPLNLFSKDIVKWNFDTLGNSVQFVDAISNLNAEVFPKSNYGLNVSEIDCITSVFFNDTNKVKCSDDVMLLVSDDDLLTGHQDDGYGYASFTVEFEFNPTKIKYCHLLRKVDDSTKIGYDIWMTQKGELGFSINNGKNQFCKVISKRIVEQGKWHKVIATWDSPISKL